MSKVINYVEKLKENAERERIRTLVIAKGNSFREKYYKSSANLAKAVNGAIEGNNIYCTLNTFYKPKRATENISQLENLYIDLDCYNLGYSKEQVLYFLEEDYINRVIPKPNMIVDSGRGLYLIWNIRPVPIRALPLWTAVERYFLEVLKELGADPLAVDPVHVFRVVGTVNQKCNNTVETISEFNYRYDLAEIKENYLKELQVGKKTKGQNKAVRKIIKFFNDYSLYRARIEDLKTLCELREWDLEGQREVILFLYRYWTCLVLDDTERALEDVLEFNKEFTEPLPKREVTKATKSAERYYKKEKYKYTNKRLIELLGISEEEQKHMATIINTKEKYRRKNDKRAPKNEAGLTKKQQELKELKEKVLELKEKGLSNRAIAKELNFSEYKVRSLLNK